MPQRKSENCVTLSTTSIALVTLLDRNYPVLLFSKSSEASIELLMESDHLETMDILIRSVVESVFIKRFSRAKNGCVPSHDCCEYHTYRFLLDVNNLNGDIMEKFAFPLNRFEKV